MGKIFKQILFSLFALIAISAFPYQSYAEIIIYSDTESTGEYGFYETNQAYFHPQANGQWSHIRIYPNPTYANQWFLVLQLIAGPDTGAGLDMDYGTFGPISDFAYWDGSTEYLDLYWNDNPGIIITDYTQRQGSIPGGNSLGFVVRSDDEQGDYFNIAMGNTPIERVSTLYPGNSNQYLPRAIIDDSEGTPPEPPNTSTRIVDFNPQDGATTTSPVDFMLQVYINEADITSIKGVRLTFHNIDQNVLFSPLTGFFNPNDIYLLEASATSTGLLTYNFDDIPLADGNYRIEACIQRNYLLGFIQNPFSPINDCQSHQFIVGAPTFIGNVSQALWQQTNEFYQGFSSTTSTTTVSSACNPLNGSFDLIECGAYMLVPDGQTLKVTLENARDGFLERMPWGYFTRFFTIMSMSTTTPLPDFDVNIPVGGEYTDFNFTPMIQGALEEAQGLLEGDIVDPLYDKSIEDVLKPILTACLAMSVLGYIVNDIIHGVRSHGRGPRNST